MDDTDIQPNRHDERGNTSGLRAAFGRRRSRPTLHDSPDTSRAAEIHLAECGRHIEDLNSQLAVFRDLVMHIGKPYDCPETRDKIRETRRKCIDLCYMANDILMPQIRSDVAEGIPVDSQHLVNLVCCAQLLLRELQKCRLLVIAHPMDMNAYYERRPRSSGVAVLDKLVLWRPPPHDYHQEEIISIKRDSETVASLLYEMKEFMPHESSCKSLIEESFIKWREGRKRGLYRQVGDWCCLCKSNFG